MALRVQDSQIVFGRDGQVFQGDTDAITRSRGTGPATSFAQTCTRDGAVTDHAAAASGTLRVASAVLPAGQAVSTVTFVSGATAAISPTNQWAAIYAGAAAGARLGLSADLLTAAWAANTAVTFTLATPFTPVADTPVYLALCVVAGTLPTLRGLLGEVNLNTIAPIRAGATADTGLTTPATAPATLGAVTAAAAIPFAFCR